VTAGACLHYLDLLWIFVVGLQQVIKTNPQKNPQQIEVTEFDRKPHKVSMQIYLTRLLSIFNFYSIAIFNLADFVVTEKSCKMARVGLSP